MMLPRSLPWFFEDVMKTGIHFISGLPRSGSTLLAAILRQNPRFHAAMTSPIGSMYMALESAMSRRNETAVFINDTQRRDVLRGIFTSYYQAIEGEKLVFDTNRVWCAKLPALMQLFPNSRVICCVRSIGWIMDSIERLVRKNAFELSGMFGFEPGNTVYTRINRVAMSDGMVGYALDALKEGFFGEQGSRLILVEYDALARDPSSTMQLLYSMLDEQYFAHDFSNVDYAADDFDLALGAPGLHTIRRTVDWVERQTVMPPELFRRFEGDMFWRYPEANIRGVPIIRIEE
ncbi:sulfotransferase [Acidisphaera sp. L21]|uniref:sulfotransferase family protein n=1 Tax=Acidisphaera sp. L21 TaxID=1641851 RepID=UPI0020B129EB|nr:sulfotransferase [Acidisphaera sp. L21]